MRSFLWILLGSSTLAGVLLGPMAPALADGHLSQPVSVIPAALAYDSYYYQDDTPAPEAKDAAAPSAAPCGCGTGSCDACCDRGHFGCLHDLLDHCCLGEPWTLMDHLHPCCKPATTVGGWVAFGYYDERNGLFNNHPGKFHNTQSWLYVEREADGSNGWDWGFRFDMLYGTDGPDTQSFGNPPGTWDFENGFDHGIYGWALPQLYFDVAYGNWSVRAGHFFTLVGYEVVAAPQNFFFSHAITMYNTEPFMHTGAYATYDAGDDVKLYGGWSAGWDTGYDQVDGGSNFLGGFGVPVADDVTATYILTAGNFGFRGRDAYSHSLLFDVNLTDRWQYVLQSDLLRIRSTGEDNVGVNQYLFYTLNDCWKAGARLEWWKGDGVTDYTFGDQSASVTSGSASYYETTFGLNYRPQANLVLRPEVRYEWAPYSDFDQTVFGIDAIATF